MDKQKTLADALQAVAGAPPDRYAAICNAAQSDPASTPASRDEGVLLYSVAQAARRLNVSRSTVWRILRARGIKKVELYPGCERIRCADIEALAGGAQ